MTEDDPLFTDAQRGSIGVCVSQLEELVRALRSFGVVSPLLVELERAVGELEASTGARRPRPPRNRIAGTLAQMRVLEQELRPRHLAGYGAVSPAAAAILDEQVGRLAELTEALADELAGQRPASA